MPSSYTSNLRLTLPVSGELTGTWGDTVNDGITSLLDSSIAGAAAVAMTDADYTLTEANGATDQARQMFLTVTGTLTSARNIICPANSKLYFIKNSTTGGFAVTLKTSAGTGISVPNGKATALQVVGGNVLDAATYLSSLQLGSPLAVSSGGTGTTSTTFANLATNVTGTLPVANGGTGNASIAATSIFAANTANTLAVVTPTANQSIRINSGGTAWEAYTPSTGSGSVTTVSVVSANGLAGTVANPTSTPAITLTTSVTGVLKGNGTAISAAVAGTDYVTPTGTETLTNKRVDPRVVSAASASTLTPDVATADQYAYTALAAALTINAPTGTPVDGNKLIFRFLDNGTARALTWNATYTAIGVTLPTTTTLGKMLYVGCIYNAANTRWDVVAVATEA